MIKSIVLYYIMNNCGKRPKTAKQSRKKALRKTIKKLSKTKALRKIKNIIEKRVREIIRDNISKQKGGGTEGSNVLENILNAISQFFQDIWEYITKPFTRREQPNNNNKQVGKSIESTATESNLTNKELKNAIKEIESFVSSQAELDTISEEGTISEETTAKQTPPNKKKSQRNRKQRSKNKKASAIENKKYKNTRKSRQKRANERYGFSTV